MINAEGVASGHLKKIRTGAQNKLDRLKEKPLILIGTATCGRAAGAMEIMNFFRQELERLHIDAQVLETGCMGHCYAEPVAVVYKPGFPGICYGYLTREIVSRLVEDFLDGDDPCAEYAIAATGVNDYVPTFADFPRGALEKKIILEHCGFIDPTDIDHYLAAGGYEGLAAALARGPEETLAEISRSGLRGRGGAGFPTGQKWASCAASEEKTRYIICNADEGDPGAFMDRAILESNPHMVIEGLAIAAYAAGAARGFFYIRSEYPLALERVGLALDQARRCGLIGDSVLGTGFKLDISIFQGAGAFVCGEETALISSMEGKAGTPRHRPPYPSEAGLFSKPTIINNVKTLSYVPQILKKGAGWYKELGVQGSPGTAVFTLAGKVNAAGLTEVPMGTSLKEIIYGIGGGISGSAPFKAVQIGGPSGGCIKDTEIPVDYGSLSEAGAMMGSGGMVVMDANDCMVEMARFFLDFTQKESCGKCTFCRLGTRQMLGILERITRGDGKPEDLELLLKLAKDTSDGSLCNLGKTAPNPVLSTLKNFRQEYEAHIKEKRCPSLSCKDLIAYHILPEKCERSCDACVGSCPVEAIYSNEDRIKVIDREKCVKCNSCLTACPPRYSAVVIISPPDPAPGHKKGRNGQESENNN